MTANYLFRGVRIPAGHHILEFDYQPASFRFGLLITVISSLVALGLVTQASVRRTRPPKRAVFFDRDGVLNEAVVKDGHPFPPPNLAALRVDPSASACIARLRDAGFAIVVVTNQPDVARGTVDRGVVESINTRLAETLGIDAVYVCYHDNADQCACRKPKPGMLLAAAADHGIDLERSYLVGDRWSDVAAGREARCKTVWIERGYAERTPEAPDARVSSLTDACNWILDDCDQNE